MIIEKIFIMHFLQEYLLGLDIVLNRIKEHGEGRSNLVIFNEHEGKVAVLEAEIFKRSKRT